MHARLAGNLVDLDQASVATSADWNRQRHTSSDCCSCTVFEKKAGDKVPRKTERSEPAWIQ